MVTFLFWLFVALLIGLFIIMCVLAANWSYWNKYIKNNTSLSTSTADSIRTISAICTIFVVILVLVLAFGIFMFYRHLNYLTEVERKGDFTAYIQAQNEHRRVWENEHRGALPPGYMTLMNPSTPTYNPVIVGPVPPVNINVEIPRH